jgi:hypothetical protein
MHINYLAILIAAICTQALGAFWYSPLGFGRTWMALSGLKLDEMDPSAAKKGYLIAFISNLARAYVIAWLILFTDAHGLDAGLRLGAWVGLGIVATSVVPHYYFSGHARKLYLIDAAYYLLAILITTSILAVW